LCGWLVGVGRLRRLAGLGGLLLLGLFVRHVVADRAANGGTGQAMVARNVARDTTDDGTLDAAGLGSERSGKDGSERAGAG